MQENTVKTIDPAFKAAISHMAARRVYAKIQYFTDLHEYIKLNAVIKEYLVEEELLILASGEKIPLSQIIGVDDILSPLYPYFQDFTCDC